jgi:hypothetical protein
MENNMNYALILLAALAASPALAAESNPIVTARDCSGVTKDPNGSITITAFNLNGGQILNMQLRTDAIRVAGKDLFTEFDNVCFGANKK